MSLSIRGTCSACSLLARSLLPNTLFYSTRIRQTKKIPRSNPIPHTQDNMREYCKSLFCPPTIKNGFAAVLNEFSTIYLSICLSIGLHDYTNKVRNGVNIAMDINLSHSADTTRFL